MREIVRRPQSLNSWMKGWENEKKFKKSFLIFIRPLFLQECWCILCTAITTVLKATDPRPLRWNSTQSLGYRSLKQMPTCLQSELETNEEKRTTFSEHQLCHGLAWFGKRSVTSEPGRMRPHSNSLLLYCLFLASCFTFQEDYVYV